MTSVSDIVLIAVREGRDLRFWHDAARVTLSPYLYGRNGSGKTLVAGVTSDGRSVLMNFSEMIGVEIVPRQSSLQDAKGDTAPAPLAF